MPSDHGPSAQQAAWDSAIAKLLKGASRDTLVARNRDGIVMGPLFARAPATVPAPWRTAMTPVRIVQRVDHVHRHEAVAQAAADAGNGAMGLALVGAGALSAQGYGIAIAAVGDLEGLCEDLPIGGLALRLDLPQPLAVSFARVVTALIDRCGVDSSQVDLGLDPLGWLAATGQGDPDVVGASAAAFDHVGAREVAVMRADGRPYHAAGASEAQELAAVLATGVAYLRALDQHKLASARSWLSFTLVADADQILTIAKFRALRRLWACVERACGLDPKPIRLHAETAWRMLTRRDPNTNLLRNSVAASAAIMGGADSLTVLPHTSALGPPDAIARRLARNTSLVLQEEADIGRVADPAAGAGGFEAVTEALCHAAWRSFQDLEAEGGLARALRTGAWQTAIANTRRVRQADFAAETSVIVGVTRFTQDGEPVSEGADSSPVSPLRLPSRRDADCFERAR